MGAPRGLCAVNNDAHGAELFAVIPSCQERVTQAFVIYDSPVEHHTPFIVHISTVRASHGQSIAIAAIPGINYPYCSSNKRIPHRHKREWLEVLLE